jgi:hypothetical protein
LIFITVKQTLCFFFTSPLLVTSLDLIVACCSYINQFRFGSSCILVVAWRLMFSLVGLSLVDWLLPQSTRHIHYNTASEEIQKYDQFANEQFLWKGKLDGIRCNHGILWYTMVYYGILWYTMVAFAIHFHPRQVGPNSTRHRRDAAECFQPWDGKVPEMN